MDSILGEALTEVSQNAWDSVNEISETAARLLAEPAQLSDLLRDKDLNERVENKDELTQCAFAVGRDSKDLANKLMDIRKMHTGRSGDAADPDELSMSLEIHGQYLELIDAYQTAVLPNIQRLVGIYETAAANEPAVDPTPESTEA